MAVKTLDTLIIKVADNFEISDLEADQVLEGMIYDLVLEDEVWLEDLGD